ncbi:hypothetical protein GCM10028804_02590 [Larkinella terrae]
MQITLHFLQAVGSAEEFEKAVGEMGRFSVLHRAWGVGQRGKRIGIFILCPCPFARCDLFTPE